MHHRSLCAPPWVGERKGGRWWGSCSHHRSSCGSVPPGDAQRDCALDVQPPCACGVEQTGIEVCAGGRSCCVAAVRFYPGCRSSLGGWAKDYRSASNLEITPWRAGYSWCLVDVVWDDRNFVAVRLDPLLVVTTSVTTSNVVEVSFILFPFISASSRTHQNSW
jgi:hypothetical protein